MGNRVSDCYHAVWEQKGARSGRALLLSYGVRIHSVEGDDLADGPPLVIFNSQDPFVHPSECQRAEVYVPDAIVDLFKPDVLTGQGMRDTDPVMVPTDAAVATDETDFEVPGILQRRERARHHAPRPPGEGRGGVLCWGFSRALRCWFLSKTTFKRLF